MAKRTVAVLTFVLMTMLAVLPAYAAAPQQDLWMDEFAASTGTGSVAPTKQPNVARAAEVTWDDFCAAVSGWVKPDLFPAPPDDSPVSWGKFEASLNEAGLYCIPFGTSGRQIDWSIARDSMIQAGEHAAVFRIADDMLVRLTTFVAYKEVDPDIPIEIIGPHAVHEGSTITIRIPCVGVGMVARVYVRGMQVVGVPNEWSSPDSLVVIDGQEAVYTCKVTAPFGKIVSLTLSDVKVTDGITDYDLQGAQWTYWVNNSPIPDNGEWPQFSRFAVVSAQETNDGIVMWGGIVSMWSEYLSVAEVIEEFIVPEGASIEVTGADGSLCDPNSPVATGQVFTLRSTKGESMNMTMIVQGDVLGTGTLSIAQVLRLARAVTGVEPLRGVYQMAADVTEDGTVNIGDLTMEARWLSIAS